jgi:hypothetical protein
MNRFDEISLSWQRGHNTERHIIGSLRKQPDGKFLFQYDVAGVAKAKIDGFSTYTEFPDLQRTYNGTVLDIFAQRLMKPERSDIQTFYDFWEVDPAKVTDKYYMLAHTQGLLPTDNFEFLADYNPVEGLHFLTDLAHLTEVKLPSGSIRPHDVLMYKLDAGNSFDDKSVRVYKDGKEIGFIKKVHCRLFHKAGAENLSLTVKAVDQNGFIKRIFVKVEKK